MAIMVNENVVLDINHTTKGTAKGTTKGSATGNANYRADTAACLSTRGSILKGGTALLALTLGAVVSGCGASSNSAPVVYGTEPAQGRIYNSPADIYLTTNQQPAAQQPAATTQTATSPYAPQYAQTTVANVYTQPAAGSAYDPQRPVRIYNAPPTQLAPAQVRQTSIAPAAPGYDTAYTSYDAPVSIDQTALANSSLGRPSIVQTPVVIETSSVQEPSYRGLPPSPTYIGSAPQQLTTPAYTQSQTVGNRATSVTVQQGDTVYAISRRTGVSPNEIISLNGLVAPYALAIGQTILLPTSSSLATTARTVQPAYNQSPQYSAPSVASPVITQVSTQPSVSAQPIYSEVIARDVLYTVSPGDTLYSIARRNNITVKAITIANRMRNNSTLNVGQQLLLPAVPVGGASPVTPQRQVQQPRTVARNTPARVQQSAPAPVANKNIESLTREASYTKKATSTPATQFQWPVKGAVISNFGTAGIGRRNDGINIAATEGATIRAAADGEVVYRGAELDGYGNLLLIKHDGGFVTAYAHVDKMFPRKGQRVSKGQVIGKVGKTGAVSQPQLHFEIRHNLKSVDPLRFLASN